MVVGFIKESETRLIETKECTEVHNKNLLEEEKVRLNDRIVEIDSLLTRFT